MKKYILLFFISSFMLLGCQKPYSQQLHVVSPEAFSEKIENTANAQILDVRTPEEFQQGHLLKAQNIDWLGTQFEAQSKQLDPTKAVFVYCKSGRRSKEASSKLKELGFTTIYELDGGFLRWHSEGMQSTKN
ncbi:rhodanese-like domain-containing protein [Flavobacterium crassostreae]|uniref:Rhodanese-like domain-containing protein n=1 Tax=Flavobacterium crassostreae TaxID=1763534 RepID=A0A1B9E3K9_9FLAO|nr:rhodanese-like domain-containing protein [Flavobacterium crassostreae]OCB76488.1 rhodanese-like domain-containing protein [Flavobacterium crassostreae]